jgi:ABC-2 type transport system permease protein/lipopolysaccharide transport system permease protein
VIERASVEAPPTELDLDPRAVGGHVLPDEPRADQWFRRRVRALPAVRELWHYRELILSLAERDLRVRYKQAALGVAWALLTPVLLMGAFSLVFTKFTHVGPQGVPYPVFSYVGLIPWSFFSTALSRGGTSLVLNIPLLNKLYCPREVFPLASIALATADGIAATAVLPLIFVFTGTAPKLETLYAPLLLLIALLFTIGLTLAMAATLVYLRDLQMLLPVIVQFGLFVTPVAYPMSSVTHTQLGQVIYSALNPLAPVIDGLRRGILYGHAPQWLPLLAGTASATIVLVAGFKLFKRLETGLADIA